MKHSNWTLALSGLALWGCALAADTGGGMGMGGTGMMDMPMMKDHMSKMHDHMKSVKAAKSDADRTRLMEEHMEMMDDHMDMMMKMMCGGRKDAPAAAPADADAGHEGHHP